MSLCSKSEAGRPVRYCANSRTTSTSRLAAILTLNTIAHTVGAAGAGAQAAVVFGSAWLGVSSAVLTLLILILSEIIPKTLGATHWRSLAPATAYALRALVWVLYPFVVLSRWLTRDMTHGPGLIGFSRSEFAAMAEISASEGQLGQHEADHAQEPAFACAARRVRDAMTPRTVVFFIADGNDGRRFHRRPRKHRVLAYPAVRRRPGRHHRFRFAQRLAAGACPRWTCRPMSANGAGTISTVAENIRLSRALREFREARSHIMLVVNEYGEFEGILTLEDLLETLLGLEIVDESDKAEDMQDVARRLWKHRAKERGLEISKLQEDGK